MIISSRTLVSPVTPIVVFLFPLFYLPTLGVDLTAPWNRRINLQRRSINKLGTIRVPFLVSHHTLLVMLGMWCFAETRSFQERISAHNIHKDFMAQRSHANYHTQDLKCCSMCFESCNYRKVRVLENVPAVAGMNLAPSGPAARPIKQPSWNRHNIALYRVNAPYVGVSHTECIPSQQSFSEMVPSCCANKPVIQRSTCVWVTATPTIYDSVSPPYIRKVAVVAWSLHLLVCTVAIRLLYKLGGDKL